MMREHPFLSRLFKVCGHRRSWITVLGLLGLTGLGLGGILLPATALADSLTGTIRDARGNPKSAVLVDVLGPTKVFTHSNQSGDFTVAVDKGHYRVRIRDGRHRAETEVFVDGDVSMNFQVDW